MPVGSHPKGLLPHVEARSQESEGQIEALGGSLLQVAMERSWNFRRKVKKTFQVEDPRREEAREETEPLADTQVGPTGSHDDH